MLSLFYFRLSPVVFHFSLFTYHLPCSPPSGTGRRVRTYRRLRFAHPRLSMVGPLRGPSACENRASFCSGLIIRVPKNIIRVRGEYHTSSGKTSWEFGETSWEFGENFVGVRRKYHTSSGKRRGSSQEMSWEFAGNIVGVRGKHRGSSGETSWEFGGNVVGAWRKCRGSSRETSWEFAGNFMGVRRKLRGSSRKPRGSSEGMSGGKRRGLRGGPSLPSMSFSIFFGELCAEFSEISRLSPAPSAPSSEQIRCFYKSFRPKSWDIDGQPLNSMPNRKSPYA